MIFSRLKLVLIATGASAVIGFGSGYITRDTFADAAETERLRQSIQSLLQREDELRADVLARSQADLANARLLNESVTRFEENIRSLSNEIDEVAEVRADLSLSAGYVRLLNDAISGADGSGDLSGPPDASPYADPASSGVGFEDLTRWQLDAIEQYDAARQRCNALIDWAEENLIAPKPEED